MTTLDKVLLSFINDRERFFADRGRQFWMSAASLGAELGVDEKSIRRRLATLRTRGFIEVATRLGRTHLIQVTDLGHSALGRGARTADRTPAPPGRNARTPRAVCPDTPGIPPDEKNRGNELEERVEVERVPTSTDPSLAEGGERRPLSEAVALYRSAWTQFVTQEAAESRTVANSDPDDRMIIDAHSRGVMPENATADHLLAEFSRTATALRARGLQVTFRSVTRHLWEQWSSKPRRSDASSKKGFPEFKGIVENGRPYHSGR